MRGRWAAAAVGAHVARSRAGAAENQQAQANQAQQQHPTQKLKKYADLKQQGIISEEEYQKLKADLLSKI
jgi:Short C-terminal domain